jgi:hypothetical protein
VGKCPEYRPFRDFRPVPSASGKACRMAWPFLATQDDSWQSTMLTDVKNPFGTVGRQPRRRFTTFFGFWLLLGFLSFILAAILHFFQNCSDSLCSVQDFSDSGIFSVSEWEFTVLKSAQERAQYPVLSLPAARDPSDVITSQACGRRRSASSVAELVRQWLQQAASAIISSLQDLRRLDCFCNSRCIRSLEQPFAAVDCTMSYICTLLQCPVLSLLLIIP